MKTGSWELKRITTHIRDPAGVKSRRSEKVFSRQGFLERNSAKRIRAHDGCLGIGRRRRTQKSAISRGELTTSIDPRISEWGNPVRVIPDYPGMNKDSPWEPYVGK